MINEKVFAPIADESNRIGTLGHGFTCGGHPVAAAVALENLRIIQDRDLVANAREVGQYMQERLREISHPLVGEVRGVGLIAAIELVADQVTKQPWKTPGILGGIANGLLQENGVISRNMGDALAFCPPLIINQEKIDAIVNAVRAALDGTLVHLRA